MNAHHDTSVQQLVVQCHESQRIRCVENHAPEDTSLPSSDLHNDGRFQRSVRDPRRCVQITNQLDDTRMHTNHFKQRTMTCSLRSLKCLLMSVTPGGIPNTNSRITLSNALTKSTNKTKKDFFLLLQIFMNVPRKCVAKSAPRRAVAPNCVSGMQSMQLAFCTEACRSETSGVSHVSCHTRLGSPCAC